MPFLSSFAQPLDDFADCMSDLSDLDRCSATPSMSSVYELSCALSPASSADSLFSSEYERTSPLSHYPMPSAQESVPTTNYSSFVSISRAGCEHLQRSGGGRSAGSEAAFAQGELRNKKVWCLCLFSGVLNRILSLVVPCLCSAFPKSLQSV